MRALLAKYVEIRALREEYARGVDPRGRMRALATRFPGALREIDELPLAVIEARIAELDAVVRGERTAAPWASALARYHGWMRGALALRRAAGRERDRAAALDWLERYEPEEDDPAREHIVAELDAILHPPGGRLNAWAFEILARELGSRPDEMARLLFPHTLAAHSECARPGPASNA